MEYLEVSYILNRVASIKRDFYDVYPGFSKSINESEDCYFQTKRQANSFCKDVIQKFILFQKEIPIFRAIGVKSLDHVRWDDIGDCWSFSLDGAKTFASDNIAGPKLIIHGLCSSNNIDWKKSIDLFIEYSGGSMADDENELRIINTSKIKIQKTEWLGKVPA